MRLTEEAETSFISLLEERGVRLEGNILKVLETDSEAFKEYIQNGLTKDDELRKKRLEITRQVQEQNKELQQKAEENDKLMDEIKQALADADQAKEDALNDLDLMQKKSQFELIGSIVQVALWIIMGVGVITTLLYAMALFTGSVDTTLLGNTWSNLFGILLTNSFSIIGTIMGVKYATDDKSSKKDE
jgi:predicted RNase H-like nuclease (RuvC/YqgF family)